MKTKALNLAIFISLVTFRAGAEGFSTFECLREILPLTEHGVYQKKRVDVERPFIVGNKYIVFPEVIARKLTGFFLYDGKGAYYYDAIQSKAGGEVKTMPIAGLDLAQVRPLYQMVAQPGGLETVTIFYMPGFDAGETNTNGPVALGASVLPVIGALVSRPEKYDYVYQSPQEVSDDRLRDWIVKNRGNRSPASAAAELKVERKIVSLIAQKSKAERRLWQPMKDELRLRKAWIGAHNIDNRTFKELSKSLEGSCKR